MRPRFSKPFLACLLLIALGVGTYLALRARARRQAELVLRDLRCLDILTDELVISNGYKGTQVLEWVDLQKYLKDRPGSNDRPQWLKVIPYIEIQPDLIATRGKDALGNHFILGSGGDGGALVDARTIAALSWAVDPTFFATCYDGTPKIRPPEIIIAARQESIPALRRLAREGESLDQVDKDRWTPLAWATSTGQMEMVRVICSLHPHPLTAISPSRKGHMRIPLRCALYYPEILAFFLDQYGAQLEPDDFHDAVNYPKTLKFLLDRGVSPNTLDAYGEPIILNTVLHQKESARLLIEAGANVNVRDRDGKTAMQKAASWHNDDIVAMLRAAGAKE